MMRAFPSATLGLLTVVVMLGSNPALATAQGRATAAAPAPLVVIDLDASRPDAERWRMHRALLANGAPVRWIAAQASGLTVQAAAHVAQLTQAYDKGDCVTVLRQAPTYAVTQLAAALSDAQAAQGLVQIVAFQLACADLQGDHAAAMRAANHLRRLQAGSWQFPADGTRDAAPTAGAPSVAPHLHALLQRYPALDAATDQDAFEVGVVTNSDDSDLPHEHLWIDFEYRGPLGTQTAATPIQPTPGAGAGASGPSSADATVPSSAGASGPSRAGTTRSLPLRYTLAGGYHQVIVLRVAPRTGVQTVTTVTASSSSEFLAEEVGRRSWNNPAAPLRLTMTSVPFPTVSPAPHLTAGLAAWATHALSFDQQQRLVNAIVAAVPTTRTALICDGVQSWAWQQNPSALEPVGTWQERGTHALRSLLRDLAIARTVRAKPQPPTQPPTQPTMATSARDHTPWWLYASLGGAVLASAALIYTQQNHQDTQYIEVRWQ